jgi:hypothetical protein
MCGEPPWLQKVWVLARWEPMVPGSALERIRSVCIRFEQIWTKSKEETVAKTRQQIRTKLVLVLNEIRRTCGSDTAPFAPADINYIAHVNSKLEGIITLQKRTRETFEDDIVVGAILAFCIGNSVPTETAGRFRWCPVSGEYGQTRCGVTAVTAAHTWAGLSRRQLIMGTQRAGRRTWVMKDPRESTIRKILFLLSGKSGDKASLMSRLKTMPWSRKNQTLVRHAPSLQPSSGSERELASPEQGKEAPVAQRQPTTPIKSSAERWPPCTGWPKKWAMSPRRAAAHENLLPGPLRRRAAQWLREQGDWTGANGVTGDWILLEGRAGEIANAEAHVRVE